MVNGMFVSCLKQKCGVGLTIRLLYIKVAVNNTNLMGKKAGTTSKINKNKKKPNIKGVKNLQLQELQMALADAISEN